MRRVMGVSHDAEASADARRRVLGFFDEHLRGADPVDGRSSPGPAAGDPVGWPGGGPGGTTSVGAPVAGA